MVCYATLSNLIACRFWCCNESLTKPQLEVFDYLLHADAYNLAQRSPQSDKRWDAKDLR